MALLDLIQNAAREIGISAPSFVIGNPDPQVAQLLAFAQREGWESTSQWEWATLQKEKTFTTVSGTSGYQLPLDFRKFIFRTHWDRTNHWEMLGPSDPQEWQWLNSGISTNGPRRRFRVKGIDTTGQFSIFPTPGTTGDTIVYEYISTNWIAPRQWVASTVYLAGSYVSVSNGNIYYTSAGDSSSTPPASNVNYTLFTSAYEKFIADTDTTLINQHIIELGVIWRWKMSKNLPFEGDKAIYDAAVQREQTALTSAKTLSLDGSTFGFGLLTPYSVPDTGYGS